ncbi:MAG: hypothetical protein IJE92_01195 [Clostridia bacterium]|nr:hypothetical protein [Clostridia bacterium]
MAKNEAKIKFTAETGEFNKQIKAAEQELSVLRAELNNNAAVMKTTGASVEALTQRQGLLEKQLQVSQGKTEALTQKIAKAVEIYGENSKEVADLRVKLLNAQTAEEKVRQAIADCNKQLAQQAEVADKAESATQQLTDKIDKQQTELNKLKGDYVEATLQFGKTSDEAKELAKKIKDLSGELKDSQRAFSEASDKADKLDQSLDKAGNSARESGDGFTVAKGIIADLASNAIQAAIGKVKEFIDYLMQLPEATREIRQDLATLDTSFETAGLSAEQGTETWKELYKIFGEDDRAVEAANQIAKMAKNQEDLNSWVNITKGVWGSYQDSLPVEGLAEASNETAKTGQVTGVLADALNWSSEAAVMFADYMSEDVTTAEDAFNEALKKCTTEQERQALITDTLTKLYGGAAEEYDKASGSQLAAKEATAENILVQNQLAETMEPLTTAWQGLKTEIMTAVIPAVEKFSEWGVNALGWMKEHPVAMKVICAVLGVFATALGVAAIALGVATVAQWAMNSAVLANPLTWVIVGVVAAIAALVAAVILVIEYWDEIVAAGKKVWTAVSGFFKNLWNDIVATFKNVGNWFSKQFTAAKNGVVKAWSGIKNWASNTWNNIKQGFANVGGWFKDQFAKGKQNAQNAWSNVKNWASNTWGNIKSGFSNVGGWFKNTFTTAKNNATNAWSNVKAKFTSIKNGIVNAFSNIKAKLTAPFEKARDAIKGIADKIKGFFKGNISMPKIKLPHFSISPKGWKVGDLLKGVKPKLGIEWYAEGAILTKPTIFGANGNNLMVGGEAGHEAIIGIEKLQGYIANAVDRSMQVANIQTLASAVEELANRPIQLNINGRQFALATASDSDSVGGLRATFKNRGLALE